MATILKRKFINWHLLARICCFQLLPRIAVSEHEKKKTTIIVILPGNPDYVVFKFIRESFTFEHFSMTKLKITYTCTKEVAVFR